MMCEESLAKLLPAMNDHEFTGIWALGNEVAELKGRRLVAKKSPM